MPLSQLSCIIVHRRRGSQQGPVVIIELYDGGKLLNVGPVCLLGTQQAPRIPPLIPRIDNQRAELYIADHQSGRRLGSTQTTNLATQR